MKRKEKLQELKEFLLKNFLDENGDLDISGLDFSDFDGTVDISFMTVKNSLMQANQKVGASLSQEEQRVEKNLYQDSQEVGGHLLQDRQRVGRDLVQNRQRVKGSLLQDT